MNNDVRRKNRQPQNQPKTAAAAKPAEVPDIAEPEAPAQSQSRGQRQRNRRPANIQKAVNESLASRYDIAETDEDYEKLDRLTAESASAEPIRIPASSEAPKSEEPPADRKREAITREEMDYALEFANTLLRNMQLDARAVPAECPEDEEYVVTETADVYPKIDIIGSETGILIGHHGETLDAIQYLVNLSALRKTKSRDGDYVKIVVDIENYREKREETLRTLARRMAARAVRYKRNVFLEPMNAYERRIIHSELQSFENVSTHSVGADRDRKIIITYEGPEKSDLQPQAQGQSQGRRRRRGEGEDAPESEGGRRRRGAYAESAESEAAEKRDRRPRKLNKMPIEQLTEWLPDAVTDSESDSGEADSGDVLHVMSGLRETFAESAETVEEAEEAVEETVEETEEDLAAEAVEDAAETFEDAAETVEDAVEEAVEAAEEAAEPVESFEEKAQALADILDSIADPAPDNGENE
jgi:spoIIIJ-associated protein